MAYILINKNPIQDELTAVKPSSQFRIIKSITKLSKALDINIYILYEHFSREKKETFEAEDYRIIKCKIE